MQFKKSISALLTASLIITSIPMSSFAEEIQQKPSNPERWSFRNVYSNYVEKSDGTFPEGLLHENEKKPPKLYQNLVNLNPEAGGIQPNPSDPLYPKGEGKIIYQTPMFVDLPKDIAETVGPEDIEIYTIFSEPGENITGKLTLEELRNIYERSDTHKSTSNSAEVYIGGNSLNPILEPDRSRYSAKVINVSKPILYDRNHNVVPVGQKGGAYFTFTVNGPRETINPGPGLGEVGISPKGYGLQIDDQKKKEVTAKIKEFITAGVFESVQPVNGRAPEFNYKRPPSNPFTFSEIDANVTSAIKEWNIGGLFTGVDVDVKQLGHVLDGTSYSLAYQLMKIDANACVQAGGKREVYEQLGAFQSAWATSSPEEFIPYFNEVLTQNNNKANEAMTQAIKDKVQEFTDGISASGDKEKALHAFMKTLSGGSFIQFERDANGNLVTDPVTKKTKALRDKDGNYLLETDFDKAFANITKQGGVETSIFELFKDDFQTLYAKFPGKSNQEVRALLMAQFNDYLSPGKQGGTKLSDMLSNIDYKSPLEMAQLDPTYRTFYPIAVKLKTGDNRLNIKATNISIKHVEEKYHYGGYKNRQKITDGYVYTLSISSTLDQGEYTGPIDNIIRVKNYFNGDVYDTIDAGTHDFSANKTFTKEIITPMYPSTGMTFEYEVNPVKPDGKHNPTEKTYTDNVIRVGEVNLIASGLGVEVYATNGGKTLNIDWEATNVAYSMVLLTEK